ncbi:BTAD domain-containing putative transcriptional regulator [Actinotalea subterranea]|uniref:BTAD domain-containing putative transcriptional regulator n=1 Tax=Actinotalea subterranea TaxID=2607497 RepID=UPI0011EC4021|nr:BTAD domain-containing putative transcriptional regulator [Actinotalea subterranea]
MQIGVLGPFEVRADGGAAVEVPGARLRGLLVALALQPGHVVPRATLVDWIWGEHPPADAANALQRLASRLRKVLPDGAVEGEGGGYRLTVGPDDVDAVRFERLVGEAHGARTGDDARRVVLLRQALRAWRGTAMQEVELEESPALDAAAARLDGLRLSATEDLYEAEIRLGRAADLVPELTDLAAAHPVRERLAAALMHALVAAGRDTEALLVFDRTREALADALGVDPSPELVALNVALLRGEVTGRDEGRRTNVRAELTRFVGRETDVEAVRVLAAEYRLVTLVGPGGLGKTRLATELGRAVLDDVPDGVWLVELAPIGPADDVAQASLSALGLRDALLGAAPSAEPTERLVTALRDREALLILDNCEHVIDQAAAFAHRVLGECPRLRILATSREPLGITGEVLWPLESLAVPAEGAGPDAVAASPAVQLLVDRARAVRQDLPTDAATMATMARVCRELDGMPLAIEMAAARLRSMSVDELALRLADRFRVLTSGSRTALPRHRTLRAVIDWSWELLPDAERTVLRRLSVFYGGAGQDGAERVCAGGEVGAQDVPELLASLVEKSLLVAQDEGAPRYRLSGTIREYAAQRLAEAGEQESARRAHLAYVTELAEAAEPHLRRVEQLDWIRRLQAEHDNLAAALRGAIAAGEAQEAMRLAATAGWYWWLGGHKTEGMELITAATRIPGDVADETKALVYMLLVQFVTAGLNGQHEAEEWIRKAHHYARRSGTTHPLLGFVGVLERMLDGPEAAEPALESLLGDEDPWVRALARLHLGKMRVLLGHGGRDADAYLEAALIEFRAVGERFGISFALAELGERIATRGEFAGACEHYEEAIGVVAEVGADDDVIRMRARQAQLYWLLGDAESCAAALADAERLAARVTWPDALAMLALAKAGLARWRGDVDEARHQLDVATGHFGDDATQAPIRTVTLDLQGFLSDDLEQARAARAAACEAATEAGYPQAVAAVLVGVADHALRLDDAEQAARLLGASVGMRGLPDRSNPDATRIERTARRRLGERRYAALTREGAQADWADLVAATLTA